MFRRRGGSSDDDPTKRQDEAEAVDEERDVQSVDEAVPEDTGADLESQAADYLADNDTWLYGPNARDVLDILDRLEELETADASTIAEAWRNAPKSDRDQARKAVRKLTESGEGDRTRQVRMAREEVGAWLAVAAEFPEYSKFVPDWARTCATVSESAMDAVTAIILEDDLEETNYQALISPWNEALDEIEVRDELEEVEGEPAAEGSDEADEDEEAEAEGVFGPNSDAVDDFLNRLWLISSDQVSRLVSAWEQQPEEDLELAHEALHDLVEEEPDLREQIRAAQEKISPWLNGGRLEETASFMGQTGQSTSRRNAGPALADAVAALVVGDLLAREDAEILYAPWFNLVGAPPLPEPAEDAEESGK